MFFSRRQQLQDALLRAERAESAALRFKRSNAKLLSECGKLIGEKKTLEAQLAVFTGPRKRDERGLFVSAKS